MGCNRKVQLLVSKLFRGWEGGSNGHLRFSDPVSQNTTWRENGFTYHKKKPSHFGRIVLRLALNISAMKTVYLKTVKTQCMLLYFRKM